MADDYDTYRYLAARKMSELAAAAPKPPAASGDQYDTLAAKYACESGGCCCNLQGDDFAHFMRQAAKEAQLVLLGEVAPFLTDGQFDHLHTRITTKGPL